MSSLHYYIICRNYSINVRSKTFTTEISFQQRRYMNAAPEYPPANMAFLARGTGTIFSAPSPMIRSLFTFTFIHSFIHSPIAAALLYFCYCQSCYPSLICNFYDDSESENIAIRKLTIPKIDEPKRARVPAAILTLIQHSSTAWWCCLVEIKSD